MDNRSVAYGLVAFALVLLGPGVASGAEWDPIPQLPPDDHVAVAPQLDDTSFDPMRECLANFESEVDADYFAVIVEVTAENGSRSPKYNDAVPYVDATYQEWTPDERIDPDTDNIIALGLENRAVAIHPGNRWVQLGFERAVITRTIDSSGFKTYARNGDYSKAVCTLAEGVDRKLASLLEDLEHQKRELQSTARQIRDRAVELQNAAEDVPEYSKQLSESIDAELLDIRGKATEAFDATRRGRISSAEAKLDAARGLAEDIGQRIDRYERAVERLPAFRSRHQTLTKRIADRPDSDWKIPNRAKSRLSDCKSNHREIQERLESGDPVESLLGDTEHCYSETEALLAEADRNYRLWTRDIPLGGGGLLVVFLGIVGVWRRREHNRQERLLEAKLAGWDEKIANASSRLAKLEAEHGFYFEAGTEDWTGESQSLSQNCANAVNHAFLLYSEARELHDRAESIKEECGLFAVEPLERGQHLLEDETIEFDTETVEERRRVYLPLTQTYSGTAQQLIDDLDATYQRALDHLDRIESLMEHVGDLAQKSHTTIAEANQAVATRENLNLPTEHLDESLTPAKQELEQARSLRSSDPVRAVDLFEQNIPTAESVAERARLGNELVEKVRGPVASHGQRLRERLADLRDRSYRVAEPDFDPDLRLERTERDGRRVEELVRNGREFEAEELFATIKPNLDALEESFGVIESAPSSVPKQIDELEAKRDELKGRIPGARETLEELREKYAPESFQRESDNLEELSEVLEKLREWLGQIREQFDDAHYLAAAADIETARDLLSEGNALVDEIDAIDQEIDEATDEAKTTEPEVRGALHDLLEVVDGDEPAVPNALQETVDGMKTEFESIRASMESERPNWLEIRSRLQSLGRRIDKTRPRVDRNVEDWKTADQLADQLASNLEELREAVVEETRDRPHVLTKVESAERQLNEWTGSLADSEWGGTALLRRGRNVQRAYRRARDAWHSELEVIEAFEKESREVRRRIDRVDGRELGYDVYVSCSAAYARMKEAEQLAEEKSWESALEKIDRSREEIDAAIADAEDEYERQENLHSTSTSSSSSFFSSSGSSSFSTSSTSSFSSSSSSVGSSFGGTSSGGSSFGGSSSGGSSW